jgi:hypothetical protein
MKDFGLNMFHLICGVVVLFSSFNLGLPSTASTGASPSHSTRQPLSTRPVHHRSHGNIRYRTGLLNQLENTWAFSYNTPEAYPHLSDVTSDPPRESFSSPMFKTTPDSTVVDKPRSASKRGAPALMRTTPIPIYIVMILPDNGTYMYSIKRVRPAITIATDIVTSSRLLEGYELEILYADSKCHIATPMNEAIKMYIKGKPCFILSDLGQRFKKNEPSQS